MEYKIIITDGNHPMPKVVFEDERYNLIGEMLIAERGLLGKMLEAVDSVLKKKRADKAEFSGNAFSLDISGEITKITNDINGGETEARTKELRRLIKAYKKANDKL